MRPRTLRDISRKITTTCWYMRATRMPGYRACSRGPPPRTWLTRISTPTHADRGAPTIFPRGTTTVEARTASLHQAVSYTHLRAHETRHDLVCRLLLEK